MAVLLLARVCCQNVADPALLGKREGKDALLGKREGKDALLGKRVERRED